MRRENGIAINCNPPDPGIPFPIVNDGDCVMTRISTRWRRPLESSLVLMTFASFEAQGAPRKTTVRTVRDCILRHQSDPSGRRTWAAIEIEADGFLYNMVRNIVGTLFFVGIGKHEPEWIDEVFAAKHRDAAGPTAPAQGLCLLWVAYDEPS